jgi:hypothetical protein
MKLRITHDTIRVRLNQTEVQALGRREAVRMETIISPDSKLVSVLQPVSTQNASISLELATLTIRIPDSELAAWAEGEEVKIESRLQTGAPQNLALLIEKDFHCLHRDTQDDADTFPNPKQR